MRFRKLLRAELFVVGIGCLAYAIVWGRTSAWSAAAMHFCAAAACLIQRRKPSEEG